MSDDIRSILQRLTALEETATITPVGVKHGLNKQQKGVPQLPALFKPKKITALGSKTDPQHPMKGMAVGANESKLAEAMAEIEEDMISRVRADLNHYLDRLEKKVAGDDGQREKDTPELDKLADKEKIDRDLVIKALDAVEKHQAEEDVEEAAPPPVSVVALEDGTLFEVHGGEGVGFEIRHNGKSLPSRFDNAHEAGMAIELFKAHRARQAQKQDPSQDYIEER